MSHVPMAAASSGFSDCISAPASSSRSTQLVAPMNRPSTSALEDWNNQRDELRKRYLEIFEEQDAKLLEKGPDFLGKLVARRMERSEFEHDDAVMWSQSQLIAIARASKDHIIKHYLEEPGTDLSDWKILEEKERHDTFEISVAYKTFSFPWTTDVVTIGYHPTCDVSMRDVPSRLHLLIFPLAQYERILVIDVGSYLGFETVKRQSKTWPLLVKSKPFARQHLCLEYGEGAFLTIGPTRVWIHSKVCVVCMDRPREVVFAGCGHSVCCETCVRTGPLLHCPFCRKTVAPEAAQRGNQFQSMMGDL